MGKKSPLKKKKPPPKKSPLKVVKDPHDGATPEFPEGKADSPTQLEANRRSDIATVEASSGSPKATLAVADNPLLADLGTGQNLPGGGLNPEEQPQEEMNKEALPTNELPTSGNLNNGVSETNDNGLNAKILQDNQATQETLLGKDQQARPDAGVPTRPPPLVKTWADCVKGKTYALQKRGSKFRTETGEYCCKIPNSVIAKNKKVWANFVLGQFHGSLPSMGALHAILNGIWSNKLKDISISKAGIQSVLIKIPNAATRKRVLDQGVWHVEGQSMFVAAWEPGMQLEIPEVKEVPLWVDFKDVPPHFFSTEGLEYVASLVGEPLQLHPRTAAMINLETARVFTLVDLTEPFPEAVYVMFESGEKQRIEVSCPWLPPKCTHCNQFGHSLRRCPTAPIRCNKCKSPTHDTIDCFRAKPKPGHSSTRQDSKMWKPVNAKNTSAAQVDAYVTHDKEGDQQPQVAIDQITASGVAHQGQSLSHNHDTNKDDNLPSHVQEEQQAHPMVNKNAVTDKQGNNPVKVFEPVPRHKQGVKIIEPTHLNASSRKSNRIVGKGKAPMTENSISEDDLSEASEEEGEMSHGNTETSKHR